MTETLTMQNYFTENPSSDQERIKPFQIMLEVTEAQHMLRDIIHSSKHRKDQAKATDLLHQLTKKVEDLFDKLNDYSFGFVELETLTNLCRKINEDPVLQEIRDVSLANKQIEAEEILTPKSRSTAVNSTISMSGSKPTQLSKSFPLASKSLVDEDIFQEEHEQEEDEDNNSMNSLDKYLDFSDQIFEGDINDQEEEEDDNKNFTDKDIKELRKTLKRYLRN